MKSKIKENIHLCRDSVRAEVQHEISDVSETLLQLLQLFESHVARTNFET